MNSKLDEPLGFPAKKEVKIIPQIRLNLITSADNTAESVNIQALIDSIEPKARQKGDPYNIISFIAAGKFRHGNRFNYSNIGINDIINCKSEVTIICNWCGYEFSILVASHLREASGCRGCKGLIPWSYQRLLEKSKAKFGQTRFNYDRILPGSINTGKSKITLVCNICFEVIPTTVTDHMGSKYGSCKTCSGTKELGCEEILRRAHQLHGNKYNYDRVDETITSTTCTITVECNTCHYIWPVLVDAHIRKKAPTGCPDCAGNAPWTHERLISRLSNLNGDKYNYNRIKPEHVENAKSVIEIECNACKNVWPSTINNHVNSKSQCGNCYGILPWSLQRLLIEASKIHSDIDYSLIDPKMVLHQNTFIPLKCNKCTTVWRPSIGNHIYRRTGCPGCNKSRGELACQIAFEKLGIPFQPQFIIEPFRKKYDFLIEYNSKQYLVEYDGEQHFNYVSRFHATEEIFEVKKQIDLEKTRRALDHGYRIIRIDYTKLRSVEYHIVEALRLEHKIYYSDAELYTRFPTE